MDAYQARMQRPVLDTDQDRASTIMDTNQGCEAMDTGQDRASVMDWGEDRAPTMDTDQGHVATGQDRASDMVTDRVPTMDTGHGRMATDTEEDHAPITNTGKDRAPTMDTGQGRVATDTDQDHAWVTDTGKGLGRTMGMDQRRVATDTGEDRASVMDLNQDPTATLDTGRRSVTMDTDLLLVTQAPLGPQSVRQKVMRLSRRVRRPCRRHLLVSDNPRAHDRYCCLCGRYFQAENALATCTFRGAANYLTFGRTFQAHSLVMS
jgi:hypothetical protein